MTAIDIHHVITLHLMSLTDKYVMEVHIHLKLYHIYFIPLFPGDLWGFSGPGCSVYLLLSFPDPVIFRLTFLQPEDFDFPGDPPRRF